MPPLPPLRVKPIFRLNESPSQKEGKSQQGVSTHGRRSGLNESPSQKEGKSLKVLGLWGST